MLAVRPRYQQGEAWRAADAVREQADKQRVRGDSLSELLPDPSHRRVSGEVATSAQK